MVEQKKKREYPKTKRINLPPELVDDALTALEQTGLGSLRQFVRNCLEALKKDPVATHHAIMAIVNPADYPLKSNTGSTQAQKIKPNPGSNPIDQLRQKIDSGFTPTAKSTEDW
ncbi:MAG: hypothetical protein AAGF93_00485 [Cyanobacteria bacterium P01_H01_bin.105]